MYFTTLKKKNQVWPQGGRLRRSYEVVKGNSEVEVLGAGVKRKRLWFRGFSLPGARTWLGGEQKTAQRSGGGGNADWDEHQGSRSDKMAGCFRGGEESPTPPWLWDTYKVEKEESWLRSNGWSTVLGESHVPGKAGRQRELSREARLSDVLGGTARKGVVAVVATWLFQQGT